jgi:hypothetical protein
LILEVILSTRAIQSTFLSLEEIRGTPRYLKGREPSPQDQLKELSSTPVHTTGKNITLAGIRGET